MAKLQTIQNTNLRLITGAFKSSPINSILRISGETLLKKRRKLLELQYAIKIASYSDHPTYKTLFKKINKDAYNVLINKSKPIGIRIEPFFNKLNINPKNIIKTVSPIKPPWRPNKFEIDFSFAENNKNNTDPRIFRNFYSEKMQNNDQVLVFTDAPKIDTSIAFAIIIYNYVY